MAVFSTIGIILMVCAGILFAYQVMAAFLGMGTSESSLEWIAELSSANLQAIAYTAITLPLVVWLLFGAMFFFLIHMFRGHKKL